jgi:broad specificity phosphatase PhoE
MQFTFLRHGETLLNREGILQGHLDSDLSDKGHAQAAAAAQQLKERNFQQIGYSPLKRTKKTAQLISEILEIPLYEYPELTERNYGPWQGMSYREIRSQYRHIFQEMIQWNVSDHFSQIPLPGMESYHQISQRVLSLLKRLESQTLLVTHAGVLSALLMHLQYPLSHVPIFRSTGHVSISKHSGSSEISISLLDCEGLLSEEELRRCIPFDPQDPFVLF